MPRLSTLARHLTAETAFTVLALARALKAQGKDVVELEIGDSPFPSTPHAKAAGHPGDRGEPDGLLPEPGPARVPRGRRAVRRRPSSDYRGRAENIVVASGAKPFEQYFAEALLDPGDGVLVFSPHFPTYVPNLERRGARAVLVPLRAENAFRPRAEDVAHFLATDPRPRAIFLNSPHNPTGGVATARGPGRDRRRRPRHRPGGLLRRAVLPHGLGGAARVDPGRAGDARARRGGLHVQQVVQHERLADRLRGGPSRGRRGDRQADQHDGLVQPAVRPAGRAGRARARRGDPRRLHGPVPPQGRAALPPAWRRSTASASSRPAGTFYVFPDVRPVCNRLGITSHGLALYLLEGADDAFGVACLGGECFGEAGRGFLRFSCAEPDERIDQAIAFLPVALSRLDRIDAFLSKHPEFALKQPYPV